MNIRSASVPVNYEQTSATLIETNSLSREGTSRGDKFASGNGEKFPYRPNRFDSKHRDAIFVPPGYIYIFFFFLLFFSSPPFFIIRFSCHEVRMKKRRKYALASLANWPGCACIYRTYIPEMRETLMFVIYIYFVILSPVHQ